MDVNRKTGGDQPFPLTLILDILKRQIAISGGFLTLLEMEKKALIDMDMSAIVSLSKRKEQELTKIQQLDHSLQEVAAQFVPARTKSGNRTIKLAELIPFMTKEQTLAVKKYRDELVMLREKIATNNLINKRFANDTLGYINDAISLICGEIAGDSLYKNGMRGKTKNRHASPALVSREV